MHTYTCIDKPAYKCIHIHVQINQHTNAYINNDFFTIFNYLLAQVSKWSIRKDAAIITLHYTKSHYHGEFKSVRLRSNVEDDREVHYQHVWCSIFCLLSSKYYFQVLNTLVTVLEYHIAHLVVHKGELHIFHRVHYFIFSGFIPNNLFL